MPQAPALCQLIIALSYTYPSVGHVGTLYVLLPTPCTLLVTKGRAWKLCQQLPLNRDSWCNVDWKIYIASANVTYTFSISGNGPSGICLSYMLSGYRPYLSPDALHPNPILHSKLEEARHLSIPEQVDPLTPSYSGL